MRALKVKINEIFLSRNGSDFVEPCDLQIAEYELLQQTNTGIVTFAASGRALTTVAPSGNTPFQVSVFKLYDDVFQQLKDLARDNIAAQMGVNDLSTVAFPVEIIGFSMADNLSFDAIFNPQAPYKRGRFLNERSFEIQLNLIKV